MILKIFQTHLSKIIISLKVQISVKLYGFDHYNFEFHLNVYLFIEFFLFQIISL